MSAVSDSDIERMIRGLTIMGGQILPDGQGYVVVSAIAMLQSLRDERRPSPSYDALLIISQSVAAALERAWVEECDDPGDAIDALAKDAARYRWLRDREIPEWLDLWHQNPDRIDAAIDAAMEGDP